jgi:hypothetical protein
LLFVALDGPWLTSATRFYRWVKEGIWHRILAALQQAGTNCVPDWSLQQLDGAALPASARHLGGHYDP